MYYQTILLGLTPHYFIKSTLYCMLFGLIPDCLINANGNYFTVKLYYTKVFYLVEYQTVLLSLIANYCILCCQILVRLFYLVDTTVFLV